MAEPAREDGITEFLPLLHGRMLTLLLSCCCGCPPGFMRGTDDDRATEDERMLSL